MEERSLTENSPLEILISSPLPEDTKRGGSFLVLAVLAVISETFQSIISIRGILLVLAVASVVTQNTKHLDVLIGTLGGSLMPQVEKRLAFNKETPSK